VLGRISATSALVYSQRWAQDAAQLIELRQRLDVGVHLDWTSPAAKELGYHLQAPLMWLQAWASASARQRLLDDVHRQLDRFEAHWKAAPDHISGFRHIYQITPWREALCQVVQTRYGSAAQRPWLRVSLPPVKTHAAQWYGFWGGQALAQWAQANEWPHTAPLLGLYDFQGGIGQYARHMQAWLALAAQSESNLPLVSCQPALSAQMNDPIGVARSREFAYLVGHDFVQHLREANLRLVRGSGQPMV
jgi:predicted glycoside hydrolase/deacetylase ChbG (UPF0249 family)